MKRFFREIWADVKREPSFYGVLYGISAAGIVVAIVVLVWS